MSIFRKIEVLYFLETPVMRLGLLPYDRRTSQSISKTKEMSNSYTIGILGVSQQVQ